MAGEDCIREPELFWDPRKTLEENTRVICASRLSFAMRRSGVSCAEFCELGGVSRAALSRVLNAKQVPSIRVVSTAHDVLGVSADWLLGIH